MFIQILNDTLKNPKGKFSRKSLTMLVSFFVAIIIGFFMVLGEFYNVKFDKTYLVFETFMYVACYHTLLNFADKKIKNNIDDDSSETIIQKKEELTIKTNEQVG